jgi:hypothetical protein
MLLKPKARMKLDGTGLAEPAEGGEEAIEI